MEIIFTATTHVLEEYAPKPASKVIPQWYKDMDSYLNNIRGTDGNGTVNSTIKKCMPVFDAITSGYILFSQSDVIVTQRDGMPYYEWGNNKEVEFHPNFQADKFPGQPEGVPFPKWLNKWAIKTPKGYSTLFVQPFNRPSVFTILTGVVDTDTYNANVNFPFTFNDPKFEGIIPAGTPIAQAIPFKRDSWQMKFGAEKEVYEMNQHVLKIHSTFFDKYKRFFRQPKEYK